MLGPAMFPRHDLPEADDHTWSEIGKVVKKGLEEVPVAALPSVCLNSLTVGFVYLLCSY